MRLDRVTLIMWILQEDMKIAQDEIFGPVMSLIKFKCVVKVFTDVLQFGGN